MLAAVHKILANSGFLLGFLLTIPFWFSLKPLTSAMSEDEYL